MKTEIKTRDQVAEMLFARRKTLRSDLHQYSALKEQMPDMEIPMNPDLEILSLISVKCSGDLTAFTELSGKLDFQLIESYMQNLSINGDTVFLLSLNGRDDLVGPDDVKSVCARADHYAVMQIDESCYDQHTVYLVGTFSPAYRHFYAPETMFQVVTKARKAKEEARRAKRAERERQKRSQANAAGAAYAAYAAYAGGSVPTAVSPGTSGTTLRTTPAPGYGFTSDGGSGYPWGI